MKQEQCFPHSQAKDTPQ